jgi:signal transduction histidine kinase
MRSRSRVEDLILLITGICLLGSLFGAIWLSYRLESREIRLALTLSIVVAGVFAGLLSTILVLRRALRPYRQLVGEIQRLPVTTRAAGSRNEAEFILATLQSVVSRLQAQQDELERLNAQVKQRAASAELLSDRIVASIPSGLVAFDQELVATRINGPAQRLLETASNTGIPAGELLVSCPELLQLVKKSGQEGEIFQREELTARFSGSRRKRLGVTVAPIEQPSQGEAVERRGVLCLLTDLTEVLQLREQLALRRNLESLGEMSAGLAHELKNSLATLNGYAQLLQTRAPDEATKSSAAGMLAEVRSLSAMVTAFLDFARPQPLQVDHTLVGELIAECLNELEAFAEQHRVRIRMEGSFPAVLADSRLLRQAVINLIRNGVEAIGEDQSRREVLVSYASGANEARIIIADTGSGIPEYNLDKLFLPFFTTKSTGHGIGLAVTHRIITLHGWRLRASTLGSGGAEFIISIPSTA